MAGDAPLTAISNPLEHPHVFGESGPEEVSIGIFAEPIHMEKPRKMFDGAAHFQPVMEIVAHVVSTEWHHRHRVASHHADRPRRRRRRLTAHGRSHVHAMSPIKRLIHQRHGAGTPPPKDDRTHRHPIRIFPLRINRRTLSRRRRKSGIRVRRQTTAPRRPLMPRPVDQVRRRFRSQSLPPDIPVIGQRYIRKDGVDGHGVHGVRIALPRGARSHPEKPGLRIDGPQPAVSAGPKPSNVIAHQGRFPAGLSITLRRDQHGKVRLAAGTRESSRHIRFGPVRCMQPQQQHVFSEPSFIARHRRGNTQRQTLFPQQRIAPIPAAITPNHPLLRKMSDILFVRTGPSHIFLARSQRMTDTVQTRNKITVRPKLG